MNTQRNDENFFEGRQAVFGTEFDEARVHRIQLEEAFLNSRVRTMIDEWARTRYYDALEAADTMGQFGLSPWAIDELITLYLNGDFSPESEA